MLLFRLLLRVPERATIRAKGKSALEEALKPITFARVVNEASGSGATMGIMKWRWSSKARFLRDLVTVALCPRMDSPGQITAARQRIADVRAGTCRLSAAVTQIALDEVSALAADEAFRLQLAFQASLASESHVANTLNRVGQTHARAWTEFVRQSFGQLGLQLRPGLDFTQLGHALQATGEAVILQSMSRQHSGPASPPPAELLALVAKALILGSVDQGDGRTIDEALDQVTR
jgi:hypothetical protein